MNELKLTNLFEKVDKAISGTLEEDILKLKEECDEVLEAYRSKNSDSVASELEDLLFIVARLLHKCNISVNQALFHQYLKHSYRLAMHYDYHKKNHEKDISLNLSYHVKGSVIDKELN